MSVDAGQLTQGKFVFTESSAALDNVRFERIIAGFEQHYDVFVESAASFRFARGEGYLKIGRWDAFGYVDGGTVERLRTQAPVDLGEGNVVALAPRYDALRFTLNVRVLLVYWGLAFVIGGLAIGGDWMLWLVAFVAVIVATLAIVRVSLRRKLKRWLARESWN